MPAEICLHESFQGEFDVHRIWTGKQVSEGELVFQAVVRIRCVACRTRFRFKGLTAGLQWDRPTTDASGLEMHAPIDADGHTTSMLADLPGFTMREVKP